ncbi:MAG: NADH-quinone oxidoreductase subunit J [Candidatus Omnitrophota bacterium]|jgi:NADH-quinone oxidoreductase subunit J
METLAFLFQWGLYALLAVTAVAAVGVVTLANIFHAALCLVAVLIGVAAVYAALSAGFLAAVQILIYVGAIMTLVIFAIMLTERIATPASGTANRLVFPAALGSLVLFIVLSRLIFSTAWPLRPGGNAPLTAEDLGRALMGPYALPFEVISVVLVAALVGALVIARKDRP